MYRLFCCLGLLVALLLTSCRPKEDTRIRFGRFFLDQLLHQSTSERRFANVSYEKLFTLGTTAEFNLYEPVFVVTDRHGAIYVLDSMVSKTHKFSPSGEYMMSYGYGYGEAPGELIGASNFGVVEDSMVYMVDGPGYKISFYAMDGLFLKSESYSDQMYDYTRTFSGREYILSVNRPTLIETRLGKDKDPIVRFSDLTPDLAGNKNPGPWGTGGTITTYKENLVYTLERYPLLIQYAPDGTQVYARTTVDYNSEFEEPELETQAVGGVPIGRLIGPVYAMSRSLSITGDTLFVHSIFPPGDAIDAYDAETGEYLYSMRIPGDPNRHNSLNIQDGRIYQSLDTTVAVWQIKY